MAVNSLYGTTRLMGLSSGLDTDSIIQQTLQLHQLKIDKQLRAKTLLEWKQNTFNTIKDDLRSFRDMFITSTGAKNMRKASVYNTMIAEKQGKNADAVSVSTNLYSVAGTMTIGRVESLAKGANVSTEGNASKTGDGFSNTTKLSSMSFAGDRELEFVDGEATIEINGKSITLSENDTLEGMLKKVNSSGAGVTMSYDRLADKFSIESKTMGEGSQIAIKGEAFKAFGIDSGDSDGEGKTYNNGSTAKVWINNQLVERNTNSFDYRGVTLTLNRTTGENEEDTKVTLKRDVTEAFETIKSFVESYNTLIGKLEGMLKEKKSGAEAKYTPLTDEEKSVMTDKQIEEWETIAKKGILYKDSGLQRMVTNLRGALYDSIEGAGVRPSDIGLTTGDFFSGSGGQIVINEDKLKSALEKDPEKVMNAFMKSSYSSNNSAKYKESGFLGRIDMIMAQYVSSEGAQTRSLDNIERSLKQANEMIEKLQEKMYAEETALYKKFAAMETAMSKMQSQGDYFSSMLGG